MELTQDSINDWYESEKERLAKEYAKKVETKGFVKDQEKKYLKQMQQLHKDYAKKNHQMMGQKTRKQLKKKLLCIILFPITFPWKILTKLIKGIIGILGWMWSTISTALKTTIGNRVYKFKMWSLRRIPTLAFYYETKIKIPWQAVMRKVGHVTHYIDKKTLPSRTVIGIILSYIWGKIEKFFIKPVISPVIKFIVNMIKVAYNSLFGDGDDKK